MSYEYDQYCNASSVTEKSGGLSRTKAMRHGMYGNLLSETDFNGNQTAYTYNLI